MFRTRRSSIGIDADGRNVNAVQLTQSRNHLRVEAAISIPRADSTIPLDEDELCRVTDILYRQGFRGRDVVFALPTEAVMTSILKVSSNGAQAERSQAARNQLAKAHHCDPQALEIASWDVRGHSSATAVEHVMAVACRSELANAAIDIFEGAGLTVRAIDVRLCALARACGRLSPGSDGLVALLNVGWGFAELALVRGGVVVFERTLVDSSLSQLHASLQTTYDIDAQITDRLIAEVGCETVGANGDARSDLASAVHNQIVRYVDRLVTELKASITFATKEYAQGRVERIFVTGEGAGLAGLVPRISAELSIEARSVAPTDIADVTAAISRHGASPLLTAAVGLASHPDG